MSWLFPCPVALLCLLQGQSTLHHTSFSWTLDRQKNRPEDSKTEAKEDTWQQLCKDYVSQTLPCLTSCCCWPTVWLLQLGKHSTSHTCTPATVVCFRTGYKHQTQTRKFLKAFLLISWTNSAWRVQVLFSYCSCNLVTVYPRPVLEYVKAVAALTRSGSCQLKHTGIYQTQVQGK